MHIGSKLRRLRKERKISQRKLADSSGISYSFLSDIENERSNPSFDKLNKICMVLEIDPSYFLTEDNQKLEVQDIPHKAELDVLLSDFNEWSDNDKQELLAYLNVKKLLRK